MGFGLLTLRIALGGVISALGFQKAFWWFGGQGFKGTAGIFGGLEGGPSTIALGWNNIRGMWWE